MNKTILLKKRQDSDMDYDIEIIVEYDIKQNDDYVVIDESKPIYCKIANLILDVMNDKEDTEQLSELEEDLVYGAEMDYDILIPKSFVGKPFMIYGKKIEVKEKHIIIIKD